jgi:hypothetical protein
LSFLRGLFVTHFVHNVAATVSYDQKELLDIRTEQQLLTSNWMKSLSDVSDESDVKDILLCRDNAHISIINVKKRRRKRGRRAGTTTLCIIDQRAITGKQTERSTIKTILPTRY